MAENSIQSNDSISLDTFKNALKDFFRFLLKCFDFFILSLSHNKFLFFGSCIIGLSLGFLFTRLQTRYYETEMIVQQSSLSRKAYSEIVSNLNGLIHSGSYNDLASELNMDSHSVSQVMSIETFSLADESLEKDTITKLGLPFKIQVKIRASSVAPALEKGLINYLNNNPYVKQIREGRKKIFAEKLIFIEQEQRRLDSLKDTYNHTLASMKLPTTFYNNALDPADLYKHSLDLANQKEAILNWINTEGEGMLIIDNFKRPENPQSISKTRLIIIGLMIGMALGIFFSMALSIKERL
jgi:hypothetical protein